MNEEEYVDINLTEDEWDFIVEILEAEVMQWEKYLSVYPNHNLIKQSKKKAKRIIAKIKL